MEKINKGDSNIYFPQVKSIQWVNTVLMLFNIYFVELFYHNDDALTVKGCQSEKYDGLMAASSL